MITMSERLAQLNRKSAFNINNIICSANTQAVDSVVSGSLFLCAVEQQEQPSLRLLIDSEVKSVDCNDVQWADNASLRNAGLALGKVNQSEKKSQTNNSLIIGIQKAMCDLFAEHLRHSYSYLANRTTGDTCLLEHGAVSQLMAHAVANHNYLEHLASQYQSDSSNDALLQLFNQHANDLVQQITDLGGGRGALAGHSVELKVVLNALTTVYLRGNGHANN
ncbi:hypothetical protein [Pseudoalteromonas sp. S16_S37]|uniref:hypothetical protein n=1 Tax=Pseudoalteromonas sp. S16_S37 TaxID=2720228 RepID=UPI0016811E12|nr:hypothetical protein [Pseudoalteromonas sp. S16_S37]MBD1584439.1 hypothetical protein [Pseudoalteromonas sp. S16_S37]